MDSQESVEAQEPKSNSDKLLEFWEKPKEHMPNSGMGGLGTNGWNVVATFGSSGGGWFMPMTTDANLMGASLISANNITAEPIIIPQTENLDTSVILNQFPKKKPKITSHNPMSVWAFFLFLLIIVFWMVGQLLGASIAFIGLLTSATLVNYWFIKSIRKRSNGVWN